MAEALYRKYRPQTFADVVGQDHIERTIRNAIEQDKVSHAYLFCGPRGTGKTTTARLLAKALLCENGPTPNPDGTCASCEEIASGTHPDVYELDAASRTGVENVREEIIGRVQFAPTRGSKKVYIIDEVHMLSTAAFNALLKTLEEPPSHVVFILCTTDPQKVPETIHSRCQRFDFRRIGSESIVSRLGAICVAEGVEFDGEALDLIAHRAEGGMRNALTALEQVIAFGEGAVTLKATEDMLGSLDSDDMAEIVGAIGARDVAACFTWTARYIETGADLAQFARDLAQHFRNLYVLSLAGADVALDVSETERRELVREQQWYGPDRLANLLGVLGDLLAELRTSTNPRLSFEIALTRMVRPDSDVTLASLAERVEALEAGKSAVAYGTVSAGEANVGAAAQSAPEAPIAPPAGVAHDVARPHAAPAAVPAPRAEEPVAAVPSARVNAAAAGTAAAGALSPVKPVRAEEPAAAPKLNPAPASVVPPAKPAPPAAPVSTASPVPTAPAPASPAVASRPGASSATRYGTTAPELAPTLQNPAALQRIWQMALGDLKRSKPVYNVMYMNVRVGCAVDGQGIQVTFPASNAFAFMAVQKPDAVEAMTQALQRAAGMPLAFSVAMEEGEGGKTAGAAGAVGAPVSAPGAAGAPVPANVPKWTPPAPMGAPSSPSVPNATSAGSNPLANATGTAQPAVSVAADKAPVQTPSTSGQGAAAAVQPVMPRLRSSSAALNGGTRGFADPSDAAGQMAGVMPGAQPASAASGGSAAPKESASEKPAAIPEADVAIMPRPAPKAKSPLPVPTADAQPPRYVHEGIDKLIEASNPQHEGVAVGGSEGAGMDSVEVTAVAPQPSMPVAGQAASAGASAPVAVQPSTSVSVPQSASAPAPDDDRVPLDMYDGMVDDESLPPWDEGAADTVVLPWEEEPVSVSPASQVASSVVSQPASPVAPQPVSAPMPTPVSTPQPAPQPMPAPTPIPASSSPAPSGPEPSPDELSASLAAGFGEGVVFQEVRE